MSNKPYYPNCYRCRIEAGKEPAGITPDSLCDNHKDARIAELESALKNAKTVSKEYADWEACAEIDMRKAQGQVEILKKACEKVIEYNRQEALHRYGDAEKAESWGCVVTLRKAITETT